jgi:hypothetical protein
MKQSGDTQQTPDCFNACTLTNYTCNGGPYRQ